MFAGCWLICLLRLFVNLRRCLYVVDVAVDIVVDNDVDVGVDIADQTKHQIGFGIQSKQKENGIASKGCCALLPLPSFCLSLLSASL